MKINFYKKKYFKILAFSIVLVLVSFKLFDFHQAQADPIVYYFNNAVSTSPSDLGNYWYDPGFTSPALELPNLEIDELHVTAGVTYDGNAIFNGSGTNEGDITGNATFIGNSSEHLGGTISGSKIRRYTTASQPARDFRDSPWIVQADNAEVNVSEMSYDQTTTFVRLGTGSFVGQDIVYFNNAVDTSPANLANYWTDPACTSPALELPNLTVDEISIVSGAFSQNTFDGSLTFNGAATNDGIVTGNATFNDTSENLVVGVSAGGGGIVQGNATFNDSSVNNGDIEGNAIFNDSSSLSGGTVLGDGTFNEDLADIPGRGGSIAGTRIRHYALNTTTVRNFTDIGAWTVQADGAVVDVTGATFSSETIFTTLNGGSFVFPLPILSSASARVKTVTLTYNRALDAASVPAASDFTILRNGLATTVSNVSISGSTVTILLSLSSNIVSTDVLTIDYTPGLNPIQSLQGADAAALNDSSATIVSTISLTGSTLGAVAVGANIYALSGNAVQVIDTVTEASVASINIGNSPQQILAYGTKVYTINNASNSVSVINTLTNALSSTIPVGSAPFGATIAGNKLYVANGGTNNVSVIDMTTDTVSTTINVGNQPRSAVVAGTKVYVNNYNGGSVSVIDTLTNTVTSTITVGSTPHGATVIGTKVYVLAATTQVKIIDTETDTVSATITSTGSILQSSSAVGSTLYVTDSQNARVLAVNTSTNTITATISVGTAPLASAVLGTKVLIANSSGNSVSVINALNNTVIDTISVGTTPRAFALYNAKAFVCNQASPSLSIFDTDALTSLLPNLTSFSSSSANGTYSTGQTISITANFARALQTGSTMTVSLNSGASVVLNTVSGGTLSGTYTIAAGESTPDLSVTAITSASVSDLESHTRTSYTMPSSLGTFSGENPLISRNIGDAKNISIGSYTTIAVGQNPVQVSPSLTIGGVDYIYVVNQGSNSVSVIRLSDNTVVETIAVGTEPYGIASTVIAGVRYLYVANLSSNTVSVINASSNLVVATIAVGLKPHFIETIGTNIYVTNGQSNTVSVINGLNNTVTASIAVGLEPRGIEARGTDLYVANYGDPNSSGGNYVSVINSLTNTVSDAIVLPADATGPYGIVNSGSNVYVANYRSNNVSVINPSTNSVSTTISLGAGPRDINSVNNGVYVSNFEAGTVWTINTATNMPTAITTSGHSPSGLGVFGGILYFARSQDNLISILNASDSLLYAAASVSPVSSGGGSLSPNQTTATTPQSSSSETPQVSPEVPATDQKTVVQKIDELLVKRLKGRLLLAVEDHGKIWYVDTVSGHRYEVTLSNALSLFRTLSLGITDKNLLQIPVAGLRSRVSALALRLRGKMLLQAEQRGQIWYVDMQGHRHQLTALNLLDVFRKLALGINNENLDKILIGETK